MTTEDDFQRALDANPEDWQTRLVFADWLQDRDDPRAEGYRILGMRRIYPKKSGSMWVFSHFSITQSNWQHSVLPEPISVVSLAKHGNGGYADVCRRTLEDRAALAIADLPANCRDELLEGVAK